MNVYPEPSANFSIFSPILDELNPFVNTINYSTDATIYSWNFGDGNFSSSFEPNHKYENAGDYLVELIVQNEFSCKVDLKYLLCTCSLLERVASLRHCRVLSRVGLC